jgi:hypothetical protein
MNEYHLTLFKIIDAMSLNPNKEWSVYTLAKPNSAAYVMASLAKVDVAW